MTAIRRAFADLPGGQVHYAEAGDPGAGAGASAVLLLHQSPRSWREYHDVLPLLGVRHRAIAMDTAGFGDSAPLPGAPSIERWAKVAAELLDALAIRRAHVVGHHTGGVIAVELAAALSSRVRSLVLSSTPFTGAAFRRARAGSAPIDEVEPAADGSHLAALWRKRQAFYPAGRPELLQAFVLDALKVGDRLEEGHRAVAAYRMEDRIGAVAQPTLILRAGGDPFAAPHAVEMQEHVGHASLIEIADGMVPLPDQLPGEFARVVLDFIEGVERNGAG